MFYSFLLKFLCIVVTLKTLRTDRNLPVEKLKLISDVKGSDSVLPNCFKILLGILERPVTLLFLMYFKQLLTLPSDGGVKRKDLFPAQEGSQWNFNCFWNSILHLFSCVAKEFVWRVFYFRTICNNISIKLNIFVECLDFLFKTIISLIQSHMLLTFFLFSLRYIL